MMSGENGGVQNREPPATCGDESGGGRHQNLVIARSFLARNQAAKRNLARSVKLRRRGARPSIEEMAPPAGRAMA